MSKLSAKLLDVISIGSVHINDAGVYLNPVITPACAENECLLRGTLMATHTPALVDEAAEIIAETLKLPSPLEA